MRKIIMSAVIATVAAVSFAAPSQAGGFSFGFGNGDGYVTIGGYGHGHGYHKKHYYEDDYGYEPSCYIKKVKKWDKWGNLHIKKVKICD